MRIAQAGLMILLILPLGITFGGAASAADFCPNPNNNRTIRWQRRPAVHASRKKPNPKSTAKVWDNDNIPTTPGAYKRGRAKCPPHRNDS